MLGVNAVAVAAAAALASDLRSGVIFSGAVGEEI